MTKMGPAFDSHLLARGKQVLTPKITKMTVEKLITFGRDFKCRAIRISIWTCFQEGQKPQNTPNTDWTVVEKCELHIG